MDVREFELPIEGSLSKLTLLHSNLNEEQKALRIKDITDKLKKKKEKTSKIILKTK